MAWRIAVAIAKPAANCRASAPPSSLPWAKPWNSAKTETTAAEKQPPADARPWPPAGQARRWRPEWRVQRKAGARPSMRGRNLPALLATKAEGHNPILPCRRSSRPRGRLRSWPACGPRRKSGWERPDRTLAMFGRVQMRKSRSRCGQKHDCGKCQTFQHVGPSFSSFQCPGFGPTALHGSKNRNLRQFSSAVHRVLLPYPVFHAVFLRLMTMCCRCGHDCATPHRNGKQQIIAASLCSPILNGNDVPHCFRARVTLSGED